MKEFKPTEEDELIGPQLAVQRYLDELLQEATISHLNELSNEDNADHGEENDEEALESDSLEVPLTDVDEKPAESSLSIDSENLSESGFDAQQAEIDAAEPLAAEIPFKDVHPIEESLENEYDFDNLDAAFADFEAAVQDKSMREEGELEDSPSISENTEENNEDIHSLPVDVELEATKPVVASEVAIANDLKVEEDASLTPPVQQKRLRPTIKSDLDDLINAENKIENTSPVLSKTDPLPWAKSRFECLLFKVGGLKMAVPLVELGGIQKADTSNLTPLFGQPKWFLGVATVHDKHIRTVDTALWVMPNHYQGDLKDNFKFVIQLDRSDWGLACEVVAEAITLEPSAVKWRSDRSKRPWLAGTVIEHMCAILDVQGFIELLNDPKNGFKAHLK